MAVRLRCVFFCSSLGHDTRTTGRRRAAHHRPDGRGLQGHPRSGAPRLRRLSQPEYWREKDEAEAYPTEFIDALTQAGFLAALIPEEYGGTGLPLRAAAVILEEVCNAGCHAAAGHAQMYTMGTILRHGSEAQKQKYLPQIAAGKLQAAGFRRDRAHDRVGHDAAQDPRDQDRKRLYRSRARRYSRRARSTPTSCSCSRARRRSRR